MLMIAAPSIADAQQRFQTPREAASALANAVRTGELTQVLMVLGRGANMVSSGDNVADADIRQRFLAAYDEQNQIEMDGDSKAILVIGKDAFPFPIPLLRRGEQWSFDAAAGRQEILLRRIGRNELNAIRLSSPMSMHSSNMLRRIAPAQVPVFIRNGS